jgi:hypothetical protein
MNYKQGYFFIKSEVLKPTSQLCNLYSKHLAKRYYCLFFEKFRFSLFLNAKPNIMRIQHLANFEGLVDAIVKSAVWLALKGNISFFFSSRIVIKHYPKSHQFFRFPALNIGNKHIYFFHPIFSGCESPI